MTTIKMAALTFFAAVALAGLQGWACGSGCKGGSCKDHAAQMCSGMKGEAKKACLENQKAKGGEAGTCGCTHDQNGQCTPEKVKDKKS